MLLIEGPLRNRILDIFGQYPNGTIDRKLMKIGYIIVYLTQNVKVPWYWIPPQSKNTSPCWQVLQEGGGVLVLGGGDHFAHNSNFPTQTTVYM